MFFSLALRLAYLPILTPNLTIKADLGTARREYVSTTDAPNKFRHVELGQIEAIQAINVKGSEAHLKLISHRAQLCDTIRAKGVQKYIQTPDSLPKDDVKSKQSTRVSKKAVEESSPEPVAATNIQKQNGLK
ncbi:uncharacterized protein PADG_08272 [Paracoccidioides brasiliensis Pb18]|uniref:Uncharacterized protein n=1 Tax=Paracoccidioides brasiliensis (strain Pb18) TaxID=502780 RepID=C1GLN1_PARBD|nr:uncharacterized protein PADG_08272 [Paracoccidioides brasiliensis Pb18]EEH43347.2 hypothetical protein PADG_08272 [Paracoccidioides brasiliensis Pb18]